MSEWSFNPWEGDFFQNPYPYFDRLREKDPIHWSEAFDGWVLTSYDLVKEVVLKANIFSSDKLKFLFNRLDEPAKAAMEPLFNNMKHWAIMLDGDEHRRIRNELNKTFNSTLGSGMAKIVESVTEQLLDDLEDKLEFDLIEEFAYPLPALVIAEILGVPKEKTAWFKDLSTDISKVFNLASNPDPECAAKCLKACVQIEAFLKASLDNKDQLDDNSLFYRLSQSELTEQEIISTLTLMLVAGHETTTQLIANSVYCLLTNPKQKELFIKDFSLASNLVEESLRFESPVQNLARVTMEDYELDGVLIKQGQKVVPFVNAANRDPQVFEEPNKFDILRKDNRHLAFGVGKHLCTGASLARIEGIIALEMLFKRFPKLEFADQDQRVIWVKSVAFRQLETLVLKRG